MSKEKESISFEEAFKRLEEAVNELESGELSLDESLRRFEEGISLLRTCRKGLEKVERKIEILMTKDDGSLYRKSFHGELAKEEEEEGED